MSTITIETYRPNLTPGELDSTIETLVHAQRRCEWLLCRYLADVAEGQAYRRLGHLLSWYADVVHYARERFGLGVKVTRERVRIGRALRELPRIEAAFVAGTLSYSKVREVTRVATAADEGEWLRLADVLPMRQLEQRVAGRVGGEVMADGPVRERWRTSETVEVSVQLPAVTWALLRRAMDAARQDSDESLSDASALEVVANRALAALCQTDAAAAADPRKAVVLYTCRECGEAELETGAGAVVLSPTQAAQLGAGAKVVDLETEGFAAPNTDEVSRARTSAAEAITAGVSTDGAIPAAVRRAVMARDRGRCRFCGRRKYLDIHHLTPRSRGGGHSRDNCVVLCSGCHRAVHDGKLQVWGSAERRLEWRDGKGRLLRRRHAPIGARPSPAAVSRSAAVTDAPIGARPGRTMVVRSSTDAPIGAWPNQSVVDGTSAVVRAPIGAWPNPPTEDRSAAATDAPIGARSTASAREPAAALPWNVSADAEKVLRAMANEGGWHPDRLLGPAQLDYPAVSRALLELALVGAVQEGPLGYYSPAV